MALIFPGRTPCRICGQPLQSGDDVVALPAFLPPTHELSFFSDGAFHRGCFDTDSRVERMNDLYTRYRAIWESRPKNLKTLEEIEDWGREAFKDFR